MHPPEWGGAPHLPSQPCGNSGPALPKKTPLPALHPRPYAQKGLCLPTSRPADQMWAWGMAGRPKEPGGHLICNWALCTPHLPAYSSLTTAQLKSTLRGNGPSVHLHAPESQDPKKGASLWKDFVVLGPLPLAVCFTPALEAGLGQTVILTLYITASTCRAMRLQ